MRGSDQGRRLVRGEILLEKIRANTPARGHRKAILRRPFADYSRIRVVCRPPAVARFPAGDAVARASAGRSSPTRHVQVRLQCLFEGCSVPFREVDFQMLTLEAERDGRGLADAVKVVRNDNSLCHTIKPAVRARICQHKIGNDVYWESVSFVSAQMSRGAAASPIASIRQFGCCPVPIDPFDTGLSVSRTPCPGRRDISRRANDYVNARSVSPRANLQSDGLTCLPLPS
jgi:hypothetical protein